MGGKERKGERNQNSREKLLEVGTVLFSEKSPDSVSVREIAREAGVNVAAVAYHFGSKQGFYEEVVRKLIAEFVEPLLTEVESFVLKSSLSPPEKVREVLSRVLSQTLRSPSARKFAAISSREHLHPTSAHAIIFPYFSRFSSLISRLIRESTGLPETSFKNRVLSHAIIGEVMGFRIGAFSFLKLFGETKLHDKAVDEIASTVAEVWEIALEKLSKTSEVGENGKS